MKMKIMQCLLLGVVVFGLPIAGNAQVEDRVDFVIGLGFVVSSGYKDVLDDSYSDYNINGGYGWLDIELGVRINITEKFSVTPGVDLLINGVSGAESFVNTIILPSVAARYSFMTGSSPYISGEVNYGIPNTGGDRIDAESDGVGFGAGIGYEFDFGLGIEIGYLTIPVTVNNFRDEDFGGFMFKINGSF
jgi:hypothetical protein